MARCSTDTRGRIHVRFPYHEVELRKRVKTIRGWQWDPPTKSWTFPATSLVAQDIVETLGDVELDRTPGFQKLLDGTTVEVDDTQDIPTIGTPPWPHQKRAFWFVARMWNAPELQDPRGGAMLALDMGTGKTKITIDLIQNFGFSRVLVVCPKKVVPVWPYEFKKHCGLTKIRILPLEKGTTVDRAGELLAANEEYPGPLIVVLNYEATRKSTMYRAVNDAIRRVAWGLIVADECHRIKKPGGKDSRFFKTLGTRTPCRLGLTGTPMPHGPMDIYAQFRFLDPSIFGNSFVRFRNEYAVMIPLGETGVSIIDDYKNEEDLAEKFSRIALQIRAEDVFPDLPGEHHVDKPVMLDSRTYKAYQEMDRDFITWVGDDRDEVTAQNALVKLLKLQELTGGFLRNPDTGQVTETGTEKLETILEILDDLGLEEPVAIACRFRPEIDRLREALRNRKRGKEPDPISCSEISGKYNELADWQAGKTRVLICQVQSAKEGIDCTRARYVILNSIGFSYGDYHQFLRRFRRPGQESDTVTYIHLLGQGPNGTATVDARVKHAVEKKEAIVESILREVRI